nr:PREDICTED: integrator complex subunit 3 homolog [Daucus carota subsp. sativus]XP_017227736.1 PREDICTED: integrator complex subunit 3 homolog [Daucus carota subsp. sativus]XP_017227737.1 PREDICTED: integrator complex subunit 3 homolog [Daucus carota subsp. sativus]XP_017227738.1 PREDICTED: integrator complex subunit 3 homolog [Daucus carota subsp. sativus]
MGSRLIVGAPHEADNLLETSLREAFELLESQLSPPFSLKCRNELEYFDINKAIIYGILCEPQMGNVHIKHLHGIVTDGYAFFTNTLVRIVDELYEKLVDSVRVQLIWITLEMIDVSAIGFQGLLVALLRQIVGGDFSDKNLWLCSELVRIFFAKWDCLLEEEPLVLTSALYVFLRLLADHCRLVGNLKVELLKKMEIDFCVRLLRERFRLCMMIGRDLVRLLQELVHVPEFRAIWKDLMLSPSEFKVPEFRDISQLYRVRTSSRYFLLRITPVMESQLRFLLSDVKFGNHRRYQVWFGKKFLCTAEKETLLIDIVRFICCSHHPPNEIILSDIIPRWAVIGWLLKCCRKNYVEASVKLALFYDWLFFDENMDNVMNIEPAFLLMVNSMSKYIEMTHMLLDFLLLVVNNYDTERRETIVQGVQSSFDVLVRRGVVQSLDVLISSDKLFPFLKERIVKLLSERKVTSLENLQAGSFRGSTSLPDHPAAVRMESGTLQHDMSASASQNDVELGPPTNVTSCSPLAENDDIHQQSLESLVQNLGKHIRSSKQMGMQALDKILHLYVNLSSKAETTNFSISPNQLSSIIAKEFQYSGNQLFEQNWDQDLQSASAIIIRHFMFSQHETLLGMLLCWNRDGLTVGPCFLAYAINLAHEAHVLGYVTHPNTVAHPDTLRDSNKTTDSGMSLLKYHCEQYCCFVNKGKDLSQAIISTSSINVKLVTTLIEGAFAAYRGFNMHRGRELAPNSDNYLPKILYCDLMSYAKQDNRILKFSLYGISSNLRDLFLCEENIMKSIVSQLDYSDLLDIQFDLGSKKLSIFGDSIEAISHLIRSSFQWECIEQHNFWGLLRSELAVSEVPKEKVLLEFFCTDGLDPKISSIAVGGLLALCSSLAPTPDLVGAVLLLPNKIFTNFATTVLSAWAVSNTSMLFTSLAEFMDKINAGDSMIPDLSEIMINNSAFIWLLNFLDAKRNEKQQL